MLGWLGALMRTACRNLWHKKEEKWLEHHPAFSLSLAETTQNKIYSMAGFSWFNSEPLQCYIKEEILVKSDVEHSGTHEQSFWSIWMYTARKQSSDGQQVAVRCHLKKYTFSSFRCWEECSYLLLFSHLHMKIIHHLCSGLRQQMSETVTEIMYDLLCCI